MERFVTVGETIGEEACLGAGRQKSHAHAVPSQVRYRVQGVASSGAEYRVSGFWIVQGVWISQVQDGQARKEMLEACRESRHAGKCVEKMAEHLAVQVSVLALIAL